MFRGGGRGGGRGRGRGLMDDGDAQQPGNTSMKPLHCHRAIERADQFQTL